jgi:CrcB protein
MLVAGIAVAGALGAPVRYLVDGLVQGRRAGVFPLGTFAVNVTGSFVLGVLSGLVLYHAFPTDSRVVLGTGFCGAYTTFSTFAYETVRLAEERTFGAAVQNALSHVAVPALAAAAGLALASV